MARILLSGMETSVSEDMGEVMGRIVSSRDGIRRPDGTVVAPPGWIVLTAADSGDEIYLPTAQIGYVRED